MRRCRSRRPSRKHSRKTRRTTKKGTFGGYKVNFRGRKDTLEKIFGARPLAPSAMTKKLWAFVKSRRLYSY